MVKRRNSQAILYQDQNGLGVDRKLIILLLARTRAIGQFPTSNRYVYGVRDIEELTWTRGLVGTYRSNSLTREKILTDRHPLGEVRPLSLEPSFRWD